MRQFLNRLEDENLKRYQNHRKTILQENERIIAELPQECEEGSEAMKGLMNVQTRSGKRVRFEVEEKEHSDIIANKLDVTVPEPVMISHNGSTIEQNIFNELHAIARARRLSRQCAGTSKRKHRNLDEALNHIHLWTGDSMLTVDGYCLWADHRTGRKPTLGQTPSLERSGTANPNGQQPLTSETVLQKTKCDSNGIKEENISETANVPPHEPSGTESHSITEKDPEHLDCTHCSSQFASGAGEQIQVYETTKC